MSEFLIESICFMASHKHTNPDGSTIQIRSIKQVYFRDADGKPFVMKNDERVYITQEKADQLYQKEVDKQKKQDKEDSK